MISGLFMNFYSNIIIFKFIFKIKILSKVLKNLFCMNSLPDTINKHFFKKFSKYRLIANNLLKLISSKYNLYYFDYDLGLCSSLNNSCKVKDEENNTLSHNDQSHYSVKI